jgi:Dna[CI] antecedent, DciA
MSLRMQRLDQVAVRAVRTLLDGQPVTEGKVRLAWQIAAGPSLARAATLSWFADGTLRLAARSEAWRQELARARPVLAGRLSEILGRGVIKRVDIYDASAGRDRSRRSPAR